MLGELTRTYRRRLGITQEELAERTGLSARAIRAIETGRSRAPRPATVRLLADAFGLAGADRDHYHEVALGGPRRPAPSASPPVTGAPASLVAGTAVGLPRQLPATVAGFAGRTDCLRRLTSLLDTGRPTSVVISGTAGVGKTALAVHWAHQVASRFPDGQLFVNLGGFGPADATVDPSQAVRGFLQALAVPAEHIPLDLAGQTALYRSLLAGRRILVVLDNARDADHVRPLIPAAAGCVVVVTSRRRLTSLVATDGAVPLALDLPTSAEARGLLIGRLGERRVMAESSAVETLIARCSRLPLALAAVAARAAIRPDCPLVALSDQLDDTGNHLDALHGGDAASDVRTIFSWSYRQLDPDAARLFRLLGLHPGPDTGLPAAAALAGLSRAGGQRALRELAETGLVTEPAPGRYALHDLMRSYAVELARRTDATDDRRAALHRMLDHYLHSGRAADRLLATSRDLPAPPPAVPGADPADPADHHAALAWFTAEITVLLAVIRLAPQVGFDVHAWHLASSVHTFLYRRGSRHEAVEVHRIGLAAARRLGDDTAQVHSHYLLGRALLDVNGFDEARTHLERARRRYGERGETAAEARTEQIIGLTHERQGDPRRALDHLRRALDLARSADDALLQGRFLNGIGWLHAHLGDYAQARTCCEQALILMEEIGDHDGAADAWDSIGFAAHRLGDHDQAVACYQRALVLYRDLGHQVYLALTLTHLGEAQHAAQRPEQAGRAWEEAWEILTRLHHPQAARVRQLIAGLPVPLSAAGVRS